MMQKFVVLKHSLRQSPKTASASLVFFVLVCDAIDSSDLVVLELFHCSVMTPILHDSDIFELDHPAWKEKDFFLSFKETQTFTFVSSFTFFASDWILTWTQGLKVSLIPRVHWSSKICLKNSEQRQTYVSRNVQNIPQNPSLSSEFLRLDTEILILLW